MRNHLVIFVGRSNAGRTLMAEALVARWGAPGFRAVSAGLEPGAEIDQGAAQALRDELFLTTRPPRLLTDLLATLEDRVDLVVTFDPIEGALSVPGNPPVVRWHIDDPRLHSEGEKDRLRAWRGVLRDLEARIKQLASLLPKGLDEFLLRQRTSDARSRADRTAPLRM